jgi:hypothetical protein
MPEKLYPYARFVGLDAIADRRQMGERFLEICEHAFVDLRGQINKLPGHKIKSGITAGTNVAYCEHYGKDVVLYGQKGGTGGVSLVLLQYPTLAAVDTTWSFGSAIDWCQYLGKEYVFVDTGIPHSWNGSAWNVESTIFPVAIRGGCAANVLARLCVSGYGPDYTEIAVSKAGAADFTVGTGAGDGARFDIRDDLTGKDRVRGLGTFEGNKLAIFCGNETLLYVADPDINNWALLRDFRVPIGTIGKRTIKRVGNDLFFASRFGVHSLRRSVNGITLEAITFSRVVQDLYFQCIKRMPTTIGVWEPRAVWDPNKGHYHLMMPQTGGPGPDGIYWARFTFTIEPAGRQPHLSWGFTPSSGWADGTYFDGDMSLAVPTVGLCDDDMRYETDTSKMRARSAVLYQGSPQREKNYKRLMVRASGDAKFRIRAYNQDLDLLDDDLLASYPVLDPDTRLTPERPLDLPFEHRAYGVQIEFESEDKGDLRIMDFAIVAE